MRHPDFRVSFGYVDPDISPYLHERSKSGLMAASADRHRRLRGVAVRALRPRVMDSMRPQMRSIIDELIDGVIDRGRCGIVRDLTDPFPARVMMPVLGVPPEDVPRIDEWATASVAIFDVSRLRAQATQIEAAGRAFEAYCGELIEAHRRDPGPDLISELIRVHRDPAVFTDPDTFDIDRDSTAHFTFGFGPHACLGAQLARIEMAEVLAALARRVESWELAGEVTHTPMSSNGNRLSLPVTFTAATAAAGEATS